MRLDMESEFVKWLATQTNVRGELFTPHRAKHYIRNARYTGFRTNRTADKIINTRILRTI